MKKTIIIMFLILALAITAFAASSSKALWDAGLLTLQTKDFTLAATGTVVPAVTGKKIKVYAIKVVVSDAISVSWRSGTGTSLEGPQPLTVNGGYIESVTPPGWLFSTATGTSLDMVTSGTGTVSGRVSYWSDNATN